MSAINIFRTSWLETVFEGRNKEYGAYDLRVKNPKTTMIALLIAAFVFVSAIGGIYAYYRYKERKAAEDKEKITSVKLDKLNIPKKEEKKEEIIEEKKPVEEKKTQTVEDIKKFVPPVIVEKTEVKEELATQEELKDVKAGSETLKGNPDGELVVDNSATEEKSTQGEVIDYNQVFTSVEVNPEPPGGINAFRKNIGSNFRVPEVEETVNAQVITRFVVDEEGVISDVQILKESHPQYKLGQEAIRVLKKSPKWKAGVMNGRNVKCYYTLPITIQITASE